MGDSLPATTLWVWEETWQRSFNFCSGSNALSDSVYLRPILLFHQCRPWTCPKRLFIHQSPHKHSEDKQIVGAALITGACGYNRPCAHQIRRQISVMHVLKWPLNSTRIVPSGTWQTRNRRRRRSWAGRSRPRPRCRMPGFRSRGSHRAACRARSPASLHHVSGIRAPSHAAIYVDKLQNTDLGTRVRLHIIGNARI